MEKISLTDRGVIYFGSRKGVGFGSVGEFQAEYWDRTEWQISGKDFWLTL